MIVLWLVFLKTFDHDNWGAMLITGFFGLALSLDTILGEKWLAIDPTTNALSMTTFDTGYSYIVGIVLFGYNLLVLFITITRWRNRRR